MTSIPRMSCEGLRALSSSTGRTRRGALLKPTSREHCCCLGAGEPLSYTPVMRVLTMVGPQAVHLALRRRLQASADNWTRGRCRRWALPIAVARLAENIEAGAAEAPRAHRETARLILARGACRSSTAGFVIGVRVHAVVEPADPKAEREVERDRRVVVGPRLDPERRDGLALARPLGRGID